jgi:hypothetical protein
VFAQYMGQTRALQWILFALKMCKASELELRDVTENNITNIDINGNENESYLFFYKVYYGFLVLVLELEVFNLILKLGKLSYINMIE